MPVPKPAFPFRLLFSALCFLAVSDVKAEILANTFSIVAADPETSETGVAVATRLPAVGMYVPFADAGAGAVASQAIVNPEYGPAALDLLRQGVASSEIVRRLTEADPRRDDRQLSVITPDGTAAAFTGRENSAVCGHLTGPGYAVSGNLLASTTTLSAMAEAFEKGEGRLSDRMLAALAAGEAAGGDKRGKQSAAILVVRPGAYFNGKVVDLRVDEHAQPVQELQRVYRVYMSSFLNLPGYRSLAPGDDGGDVRKLNNWLAAAGYGNKADLTEAGDTFTTATALALREFSGGSEAALTPSQALRLQRKAGR